MITGRYEIGSEEESLDLAMRLGESLGAGDVVAFFGGMGLGKTLFTRGIAQGMGLNPDQVSSPTFAIVNKYDGDGKTLYHFDAYRVTGESTLQPTGYFDILGKETMVIEWGENITNFLPISAVRVHLLPGKDKNSRIIIIEDPLERLNEDPGP